MATIIKALKKVLPSTIINQLRSMPVFERWHALKLAKSNKRLDICAAQFADILNRAQVKSLKGKVCFELGSGWTLGHAICCHLVGAKTVYATDLYDHFDAKALKASLDNAVDYIIRDCLSSFDQHAAIRERLEHIKTLSFSKKQLSSIGVHFIAPYDVYKSDIKDVDYLYSNSVLEHVSVDQVDILLSNISNMLSDQGVMVHAIHLEDHQDLSNPFSFLSEPTTNFGTQEQLDRGNRLRKSEWLRTFQSLKKLSVKEIYSWSSSEKYLPQTIDSSIKYIDNADLLVSHLGIIAFKE